MGPYFSSAGMCGLAESGFELIRCVTIVTVLDQVSELLKISLHMRPPRPSTF